MTFDADVTAPRLLGLEEAVQAIGDLELRNEFERFLDQLERVAEGKVILSDPYALDVDTNLAKRSLDEWFANLTPADERKLMMMSLLTQPFDVSTLWPADRRRFIDSFPATLCVVPPDPLSVSEGLDMIPFGVRTPKGRRAALADPGLARLMRVLPRKAPIETLSGEFISDAPGMYGYQMWEVAQWSEDWAVIYTVGDDSEPELFPRILGFCCRDDLEHNFISLIAEGCKRFDMGFYYTFGTVYSAWELARQLLHVADGLEEPDWESFEELRALDDDLQAALLREEARHGRGELLERIRSIRASAEELGLGALSLAELLHKAGGSPALARVERKLPEWEHEIDEELEQLEARRQVVLQPYKELIHEWVDALSGPPATSYATGIARTIRRGRIADYIQNYVLENGAMPTGRHDLGRTTNPSVRVGVIDFDEVASKHGTK